MVDASTNRKISKTIGRWLLAIVVCYASLVIAAIALMLPAVLILQSCIRGADIVHSGMPIDIYVAFIKLLTSGPCIALWTVPSASAIGYALGISVRSRWRWGLSFCLMFTVAFRWSTLSDASIFAPHFFMIASGLVLIVGMVLSFRRTRGPQLHFHANVICAILLTMPFGIALATAPPPPPTARKVWSVELQKNTWAAMNTGYSSLATQRVVFAGDRVLAVFDAGYPKYEGSQPISTYRLVSLDVKTGLVRNSIEFNGHYSQLASGLAKLARKAGRFIV